MRLAARGTPAEGTRRGAMIARILFGVLALATLAVLLYLQQPSVSNAPAPVESTFFEPGYTSIGARLVQTGVDGRPLYRLDATRIEQPQPQGTIFVTDPKLNYAPQDGNPWLLTAQQGQLPQDATSADLHGSVHAQGVPQGSKDLMQIDTNQLHLDMTHEIATTPDAVHVLWAGSRLTGRGMRADLKNGRLQLYADVNGIVLH
jgi:LPS export ABC transporter protein LptC